MRLRPQGSPEGYDTCPVCKGDFRKCIHTWDEADKAYLRNQTARAKAGKPGNVHRVIRVENIDLVLWKDGRVTWSK